MGVPDTKLYGWLETAVDLFLLNLMWLLACLPVVTAPPATAAMFGVVRDRARGKEAGIFGAFALHLRRNFRQGLVVGVPWALFGGALFLDFLLAGRLTGGARAVALSLLVATGVLYALASVFLFPVMVHYDARWTSVPKNALLLSIGRLPTTLLCLLIVATTTALTIAVPALILITGSATAQAVYGLCDREFRKVDRL